MEGPISALQFAATMFLGMLICLEIGRYIGKCHLLRDPKLMSTHGGWIRLRGEQSIAHRGVRTHCGSNSFMVLEIDYPRPGFVVNSRDYDHALIDSGAKHAVMEISNVSEHNSHR